MRNEVYERILASMPQCLERKVLAVLRGHVGSANRITREGLVRIIFQKPWSSNCTEDRQIREVIASLQMRVPILSDSGRGGYWLAGSAEEINTYAGEIVSRARELEEKARRLRMIAEREFGGELQPGLFT